MNKMTEIFSPLLRYIPIIFSLFAVVAGFPAPVLYLLIIKVFYTVVVSGIIQSWEDKELVVIESTKANCTVYLNGIPIKETRASLKNLHFRSEPLMRRSYYQLIVAKLVITLGLLYMSFYNVHHVVPASELSTLSFLPVIGYLSICFMIYKTYHCVSLLNKINARSWETNEQYINSFTLYSAFVLKPKKYYSPFLLEVFK